MRQVEVNVSQMRHLGDRTCLGLLDKLVRKAPTNHLSFRLKV